MPFAFFITEAVFTEKNIINSRAEPFKKSTTTPKERGL